MALKVTTTARPTINTTVKKVSLPLVNLEELKNVDSNDLEDGYTLVYDAETNKWVTQAAGGASIGNIDGGTF